jgi:hypothetical protein
MKLPRRRFLHLAARAAALPDNVGIARQLFTRCSRYRENVLLRSCRCSCCSPGYALPWLLLGLARLGGL